MRTFSIITLLVFALFCTALARETLTETYKKEIPLQKNSSVEIDNRNGSITVIGWNKDVLFIQAQKKVKAPDKKEAQKALNDLQIEIKTGSKEVVVNTIYPKRNDDSFWGWIFGKHQDASVEYEIFVPHSCNLKLYTTNGSVKTEQVDGLIKMRTTNGKIEAEQVKGRVLARTTNGHISVDLLEVDSNGEIELSTTNGGIDLYLPANVQCSVNARTTNGSIKSDFPMKISGTYSKRNLSGVINEGGDLYLLLETTNGSINIRETTI